MIAPLSMWQHPQRHRWVNPCARYEIQQHLSDMQYYAFPARKGQRLGGPYATADEAFDCCADDDLAQMQAAA